MGRVFAWSNERKNDLLPFLLFVHRDKIYLFTGGNIPDVASVIFEKLTQTKNENFTTYQIKIADNVRYFEGWQGVGIGRFVEILNPIKSDTNSPYTMGMSAKDFGVSTSSLMEFLRNLKNSAENQVANIRAAKQ